MVLLTMKNNEMEYIENSVRIPILSSHEMLKKMSKIWVEIDGDISIIDISWLKHTFNDELP